MRLRIEAALLVILLIPISALAQQSPCAAAELRASLAELALAAERVKSETSGARQDALSLELAKQKGEAETRLSAERKNAASLAVSNESARQKIAELQSKLAERDKIIITLTDERDKARSEAKRAKGWKASLARVFLINKTK